MNEEFIKGAHPVVPHRHRHRKTRQHRPRLDNDCVCLANPTLRDRLKVCIERASEEQRKVRKADELMDLLSKNPDVARILELVEELNAGSW